MKAVGDAVAMDEPLVELETDKVTLEVNAPWPASLRRSWPPKARMSASTRFSARSTRRRRRRRRRKRRLPLQPLPRRRHRKRLRPPAPAPAPAAAAPKPAPAAAPAPAAQEVKPMSPAVRKLVEENDLDPARITPTGKDGRLSRRMFGGDRSRHREGPAECGPGCRGSFGGPRRTAASAPGRPARSGKMTRLRQAIARRLKDAQTPRRCSPPSTRWTWAP